jgi:formimidoylglutamate deiminase
MPTLYLPNLIYTEGAFRQGAGLLVDDNGTILRVSQDPAPDGTITVPMPGKAMLPGLVNGHSHSFQRLIRGVAEHCGPNGDDFWAWRNTMYHAAASLTPNDLFDVARMVFLEMAFSGITTVGEFHYLHRQQDGSVYEDPNLLARRVIEAATSVGIRICMLRVAYARAGHELPPNPGQKRFYESCNEYLESVRLLADDLKNQPATVSMGLAPHSVRAVPLADLKRIHAFAEERQLPIHMHIAEQPAEIEACKREYGFAPIELLSHHRLLSHRMTLVHAIHTSPDEVAALARAHVTICSCPTTERNLGDGIIDADTAISQGIPFSFGSDSQATVDLLEDARELDYHLRLKQQRRVLLDQIDGVDVSERLFHYATAGGANSLMTGTGLLEPGSAADFFTVDLNDLSIAGASPEDLLSMIVFSLERTAVRDIVVNGRTVIHDGKHPLATEIISCYSDLARRIYPTRR